jgi:hypothetical protein
VIVVVVVSSAIVRIVRGIARHPLAAGLLLRGPADCALQRPRTSKEMSNVVKKLDCLQRLSADR